MLSILRSAVVEPWTVVDSSGSVLEVSKSLCSLLGYSEEEFQTLSMPQIVSSIPEPGASGLVVCTRKDGTTLPLVLNADQYLEKSGYERTVYVFRDFENGFKYKDKESLLEEISELQQMSHIVSHDLQEPIRSILGHLSFIDFSLIEDPETIESLNFIQEAGNHLKNLVEGLLEFTSVSRGHEFDLVDFDRVLRQAVRNLDSHIKETKASVSWGGDLPVLRLDVSQMVSVFQNLISNALKYHVSGEIPEVKIVCSRENFGWKISVIDNGIGLNPSQLAKSFRVFQRFHSKDKYPGTGLGLAISQKIVHRHKGKIWLESAGEGMGAIANVWLPEC